MAESGNSNEPKVSEQVSVSVVSLVWNINDFIPLVELTKLKREEPEEPTLFDIDLGLVAKSSPFFLSVPTDGSPVASLVSPCNHATRNHAYDQPIVRVTLSAHVRDERSNYVVKLDAEASAVYSSSLDDGREEEVLPEHIKNVKCEIFRRTNRSWGHIMRSQQGCNFVKIPKSFCGGDAMSVSMLEMRPSSLKVQCDVTITRHCKIGLTTLPALQSRTLLLLNQTSNLDFDVEIFRFDWPINKLAGLLSETAYGRDGSFSLEIDATGKKGTYWLNIQLAFETFSHHRTEVSAAVFLTGHSGKISPIMGYKISMEDNDGRPLEVKWRGLHKAVVGDSERHYFSPIRLCGQDELKNQINLCVNIYMKQHTEEEHRRLDELMWHDEENMDFSLASTDGGIVPCHKTVLLASSRVFSAMEDHNWTENRTNSIAFPVSSQCLQLFVRHLYGLDVKSQAALLPHQIKDNEVSLWKNLYLLGDMYFLDNLKTVCETELCMLLRQVSNVAEILCFADLIGSDDLRKCAVRRMVAKYEEVRAAGGHYLCLLTGTIVLDEVVALLLEAK